MRCTDFRTKKLSPDLQQKMLLIRLGDPDSLRRYTASLLEAAQGQGSLRLVQKCHRYYELAWAALPGDHAQAVLDVGNAVAAVITRACTCMTAPMPA